MNKFRFTGALILALASVVANGCKSSGGKKLLSEAENVLGIAGPEADEGEAGLAVSGQPSSEGQESDSSSDQSLSLAEAAQPNAAAAAAATIVLEKRDRFGNLYRLDSIGNLYRYFGGTLKCQVTNQVMDFKINLHPADEAVVYLVRNEGLNNGVVYALMDSPTYGESQCPKSVKIRALAGLTGNVNDEDNLKVVES